MTQRSTKELNVDNRGQYTEMRQALHRKIAAKLLRGKKSQEAPEIIFMGGGTAVGKSTVRKKYIKTYAPHGGIAVIDCDDIKEFIPEYKDLKKENVQTAADLVHKESGDIAMFALRLALDARMHIVFDATMKDADWYEGLVGSIKEEGYATIAIIVHAPLEVAIEREAVRAEKMERHVPREDIIKSHRLVRESFMVIEEFLPGMEESEVYDWTKYTEFYVR
ncbi:zeta toxin family protein [Paenibacillus sp. PL2-23]|uniref:zeta toxin family protein n=1 Tax=Paenibacillus sp. PL2-23 TaxID=2100729 RepID=UPI0030F981DA